MDDCESPKCHERMTLCINKKVSKKTVWVAIIALGLPLLLTGVRVWSQQEADHLRYADKGDMVRMEKSQTELQTIVKHMRDDTQGIKNGQGEAQKDIKEIRRYLRGK